METPTESRLFLKLIRNFRFLKIKENLDNRYGRSSLIFLSVPMREADLRSIDDIRLDICNNEMKNIHFHVVYATIHTDLYNASLDTPSDPLRYLTFVI